MAKLLSGTRIYGTATVDTQLFVSGSNVASSTITGALQVVGGAGIGGNLYVGGEIVANKLTIQFTTVTTTLLQTDDVISTYNTTNATNTISGALIVAGGAGIGKNVWIGGNLNVGETTLSNWDTTSKVVEVGGTGNALWGYGNSDIALLSGMYYNAGFKYALTGPKAGGYEIANGKHMWYTDSVGGTAGNAAGTTQSLTLTADGTLNVGYTSVQQNGAKFSVNGNAYINGVVTATTFVGNLTGNLTGNVIGSVTSATNVTITTDTGTTTPQYITFVSTTTGSTGLKTSAVSGLNFIASSGYHGIGITTPTSPLHVVGSVNNVIKFTGATTGVLGVLYSDATKLSLTNSTGGESFTITPGTGALSLTTNATDRLTIDSVGQVKVIVSTASTSSTTGAFVVTGGAGFGGSINIASGNNTIVTSTWEKFKLVTVGTTAAARQGSDGNGLNFTSNALWTGSAWAEDDNTKKKFAYIQHLGNGRHEFRSAATGAGISWVTALTLDDTSGTFTVPLSITSTAAASSTITGALIVSGGAGIGGNLYVGGSLNLTTALTVGNGGTGVATLTGVAYGNGTTAFTAATGAQIATALGSTNITGSAANVTGIVATNNGGTGLSSWTVGDIAYYSTGTTLTKLAIGSSNFVLTSSGSAPQWTSLSGLSIGSSTTATNIAGGLANQIPYQSAPGATAFSANLTWNNSTNTLGVVGTVNPYVLSRSGAVSVSSWTTTSPIFHSAANVLTDTSSAASAVVAARVGASILSPTFAATNAITVTDAVNLYVQEPVNAAGVTFTNNWSLWSAGNTFIGKSQKVTTSLAVGSYVTTSTAGNIIASGSLGVGTNNPGYKVDVAGSVMATQGYSDISGTNSALRLVSPGGASSWHGSSSVTGAIKIKLPTGVAVANTMLRFTVKVYTYDNLSFDINCGGYTYTTAPGNWINTFAWMTTQSRGTLNVRFGYDGTNYCVYIGELATVWSYCNVFVTDFQAGYSNYAASTWNSGWAVSWEASAFASVTATQTAYAQLKTDYVPPSASLTNTYVGFGSAGNALTGSSNLTWDGTTLAVTGKLSVVAPANTTINFSNIDSDSATYTNRNDRVLTSNGSNWAADGKDPILTLTRNNSGTTRGQSIGLLMHNENATANAFSPMIGFSALSNSGGYNSVYAAIMGRKTGANAGVDTNWNKGELHFYAAGDAYMADTPNLVLNGTGLGINQTAPSEKLHVSGTVRIDGTTEGLRIFKDGSDSITSQIYFANAANNKAWNWQVDASGNAAFFGYGGAWNRTLTVTAAGGVAFGTSASAYGSSGQVLKSNANAAPTWVDQSSLAVGSFATARNINGTSFNGTADINPTEWYHSNRDFTNGTLITTSIDYSVTNGDPFVVQIRGNSYGQAIPFDINLQGYIYSSTIINYGGYSTGPTFNIIAMNVGGALCFWFARQAYWQGFNVHVYTAYGPRATNRVTAISDVANPGGTKQVTFSPAQVVRSDNIANYNAGSANVATVARAMNVSDGTSYNSISDPRPGSGSRVTDLAPNVYKHGLFADFKNASWMSGQYNYSGNYAGLLTFAPYDGTSASTGDPSYQMAFSPQGANSTLPPRFQVRTGIDSNWGKWSDVLHSGNHASAAGGWTPNFTGGVRGYANGSFRKDTGNNNTWDGQVYSSEGYSSRVFCSFKAGETSSHIMVGLNTDPATDGVYTSIDFAWYLNAGGIAIYENGGNPYASGTYSVNDVFTITYDGTNVRYYYNDTLVRTVARSVSGLLYLDSSFYEVPSSITSVAFGSTGVGGATGAALTLTSLGVGTPPSSTLGEIRASNEITAYYSDRRLKTDVRPIDNAVDKVLTLNGIVYRSNELAATYGYDTTKDIVGLFADEVEAVLPQAVKPAPFDQDSDGKSISGENYKTIQYEKLVPLLVEAIKEQQKQIAQLTETINSLVNK